MTLEMWKCLKPGLWLLWVVVLGAGAVDMLGDESVGHRNSGNIESKQLEKAELKIELCLYFQICFVSDSEIRTDEKQSRRTHTPRFRKRPAPAKPTRGTTTPSPLKIRIQKALEKCFSGVC